MLTRAYFKIFCRGVGMPPDPPSGSRLARSKLAVSCTELWLRPWKNLYFGKHLFAKQELITRVRLRLQDFGTGKNFCFN